CQTAEFPVVRSKSDVAIFSKLDTSCASHCGEMYCPPKCPPKTRRIARASAAKLIDLRWKLNSLEVDRKVRNQQVAGSIPAGGSSNSFIFKTVRRVLGLAFPNISLVCPEVCPPCASRALEIASSMSASLGCT